MNKTTNWPHWFPKGARISVKLTENQLNFIRPAFTSMREGGEYGSPVDGVTLYNGSLSGLKVSFKQFVKRFAFSDIDISNLTEAMK